ncbi:MAG: hypothetical protein M1150_02670 [Patescibacteria group bacterium]|nr:hypothetical protein [Patescibacteria group bacterium]
MKTGVDVFEAVRTVISEIRPRKIGADTKFHDLQLSLTELTDICINMENELGITLSEKEQRNQGEIYERLKTVQDLVDYYQELVSMKKERGWAEVTKGYNGA